ncbi:MAG: serine protease [Verrucomicrobiales bacterium]|nr:serine protease [Verrucomicrobiales bacterium]
MKRTGLLLFSIFLATTHSALAQLVCLPSPRLLTLMPMGGQGGSEVEVALTGDYLENVTELVFSDPSITTVPVEGKTNTFKVQIPAETSPGIYDARVVSRLGISSPRAFTVGALPEIICSKPNETPETALLLETNSVCNAVMAQKAVDYYTFTAKKDQRLVVECAAAGIDSRLTPVVILADETGRDIMVNRTGGILDFTPDKEQKFFIKVHDLTYQGGARHFYRLAISEVAADAPAPRQPASKGVSSMSWPPTGLSENPGMVETEPEAGPEKPHLVKLPFDVAGSFYPAADVDTYEFTAKKGETWWIEVASERLGRPTDPFVLVQKVDRKDGKETYTDVAELYDIKSPVKTSSNGYSYDGPPYNVGSPDILDKCEVKEDGTYQIQIRDLFGGTRNAPENIYRMVVRKAAPDFAIAAWGVHMTLRNGDRAAFSKPMSLRAGAGMVLEVLAVRRDGFNDPIELEMKGLPKGVTAAGLTIPAGKSVGHVLLHADESAKPGWSLASITGTAEIDGKQVVHSCKLATMEWPVKDAKQEIPAPRLVANMPVSVSDSELASLSFGAEADKTWQANVDEKLTIPLKAIWREEFSGTSVKLKTYGSGFEKLKEFEVPLKAENHEVEIDLKALKVKPGDYTIAFYGGAVTKYRYNPDAVAEATEKVAQLKAAEAVDKAALAAAEKALAAAKKAATPKDIVDIVVSKPVRISVVEADAKAVASAKP